MARRLTRAESAAQTRERLLDVAGDLFEELGYHEVTIDAVVASAGFTRGAFYAHFADKADLFSTLVEESQESDMHRMEAVVGDDPDETTFGAVQETFDTFGLDTRWRLASSEFWPIAVRSPELRARLLARQAMVRASVVGMLEAYCTEQQVTLPMPLEQFATLMVALATGISTQTHIDPEPLPPDAFTTAIAYLWAGMLGSS